jgi:hypothetical protein
MGILDWIDVGKVSAERDNNLTNYFYDNGTLQRLISNQKFFLMLGRKGSGKTALFNYFTENPREFVAAEDIVVPISLDDYSWNVHALLTQNQAADSLSYRQSWRFVLMLEVLKQLSQIQGIGKKVKTAQSTMEKILGSPIPKLFDLIKSRILRLSKLTLPKCGLDLENLNLDSLEIAGGEVAFDDVSDSLDLRTSLSANIEGLAKFIESAVISELPFQHRIFICLDRVDEAWDSTSLEVSVKVIAGLIAASDSIVHKFSGNIRPIVFIREDIFETLPLNDKNKLREDCGSLLKWDKTGLKNLLLKRVNFYARDSGITVSDVDYLFDRNNMRQSMTPSDYILKRTMFRPRDMICFFSKIIAVLKDQQNDPFGESQAILDKLLANSIYEAEARYSEWLLEEVKEEWSVQAPAIKQLFEAIQNNGSTILAKSEFRIQLDRLDLRFETNAQFGEQLRFLYNNSIIGFKVGNQNHWRYKCTFNSQGFSDEDEYHVHDGLTKALNLREPRSQNSGI